MSYECLVSPYKLSNKSASLECLCYIQKFCVLQILILLQKFIPLITLSVLTIDVARHLQGRNPIRHGKECSFLLMNFPQANLWACAIPTRFLVCSYGHHATQCCGHSRSLHCIWWCSCHLCAMRVLWSLFVCCMGVTITVTWGVTVTVL